MANTIKEELKKMINYWTFKREVEEREGRINVVFSTHFNRAYYEDYYDHRFRRAILHRTEDCIDEGGDTNVSKSLFVNVILNCSFASCKHKTIAGKIRDTSQN